MFREAGEAAEVVRRQRSRNAAEIRKLGERLRSHRPRAVVTLARGSSDHAATFARYLIERRAGGLTRPLSPSIASIYGATPHLTGLGAPAAFPSRPNPHLLAAPGAAPG